MRGYSPSDAKYAETQKVLLNIWEGLKAKADKDHDGQVKKLLLFLIASIFLHLIKYFSISHKNSTFF